MASDDGLSETDLQRSVLGAFLHAAALIPDGTPQRTVVRWVAARDLGTAAGILEQHGSPAAEHLKRARVATSADADDLWVWLDRVMLAKSPAAELAFTPIREGEKVASYSPVSLFCALADGQVTADKEIPVSVAHGGSWLIVDLRVLAPTSAAPEDAPSGVGIRWEPPRGVDLMRAEVVPIPSTALWHGGMQVHLEMPLYVGGRYSAILQAAGGDIDAVTFLVTERPVAQAPSGRLRGLIGRIVRALK